MSGEEEPSIDISDTGGTGSDGEEAGPMLRMSVQRGPTSARAAAVAVDTAAVDAAAVDARAAAEEPQKEADAAACLAHVAAYVARIGRSRTLELFEAVDEAGAGSLDGKGFVSALNRMGLRSVPLGVAKKAIKEANAAGGEPVGATSGGAGGDGVGGGDGLRLRYAELVASIWEPVAAQPPPPPPPPPPPLVSTSAEVALAPAEPQPPRPSRPPPLPPQVLQPQAQPLAQPLAPPPTSEADPDACASGERDGAAYSMEVLVTVLGRKQPPVVVGASPTETCQAFKVRLLRHPALGLGLPSGGGGGAKANLIYAGHGKHLGGLKTLAQCGIGHRAGLQLELL